MNMKSSDASCLDAYVPPDEMSCRGDDFSGPPSDLAPLRDPLPPLYEVDPYRPDQIPGY